MRTKFGQLAEGLGDQIHWFSVNKYDPPFLHVMSDVDHDVLCDWQQRTSAEWPNAGASGIAMMTALTGMMMSCGLTRIVQCGHYVGFSTLVMGFVGRYMGSKKFLYTVDYDPSPSGYTREWVQRANLTDDIMIAVRDSSDPVNVTEARDFLGGRPQLVYIDSSHQYAHTLAELRLWWEALEPGGIIVMDDISQFAAEYDSTGLGGSHRAALEFCQTVAANSILINGGFARETQNPMIYTDPCGLGLLQKPF